MRGIQLFRTFVPQRADHRGSQNGRTHNSHAAIWCKGALHWPSCLLVELLAAGGGLFS